jgi:hypothetical protein
MDDGKQMVHFLPIVFPGVNQTVELSGFPFLKISVQLGKIGGN